MIIHDDGIALDAVLETPETGEDRFPLAILLHGLTSAKDRPHTILAAKSMRDAGFATLRFDLYGHGESGGEFRNHTLYKWVSNTLAVIDWARAEGYTDLVLSGHSQGGLAAALAAGMEADRIRGLVLRAPAFMLPRWAREGSVLGYAFDPDRLPDSIPAINGLTLDGNYLRVLQTIYTEDAVDRYRGPVLILHGDEDDTLPLGDSREMAARYADCELAVMHGETHHFDRCQEEMQDLIRDFMMKLKANF